MDVRGLRYIIAICCFCLACNNNKQQGDSKLFTLIPTGDSGLDFENSISDTAPFNILDYLYYYNGGGVAIADINNDGLADIYFTSNQGSNKLYLNKGDFRFEDITAKAGVAGNGNWKTGVTIVDINNDGWLDLYVSEVGGYKGLKGKNELFVNDGKLGFTEQASQYGLDIEGFNTQSVFFDYDKDGDLDVFIVNHSVHSNESYGDSSLRSKPDKWAGDKLLRNDSVAGGRKFTDVSAEAGIYSSVIGYGLNVVVADLNNDGWDDVYVSNDFHENDYYYLNTGKGKFAEINRTAFGHESRFSMGSDIADVNNDGWLDIITLDMLPSDEKLLKTAAGDDPVDIYQFKFDFGYHHQYSRNCLQLNTGKGMRFSEIGLFAGIAATDWSWAPLIADFDNDGVKDIFISNGILRRPNDLDFLKFNSTRSADANEQSDREAIEKMPTGKVSNFMFKGSDSLKFSDMTDQWGMSEPSFSNGAAYADLDNDGDLDLVVNNINSKAFLYRNNTSDKRLEHFVEIELLGPSQNKFGIGVKVRTESTSGIQYAQHTATRGFESASLQYLHFGVGIDSILRSVMVQWPDGKSQVINNVKADRRIKFNYEDARFIDSSEWTFQQQEQLFENITDRMNLSFVHREDNFNDFNQQPLIPHQLSTKGPRITTADINGDGLEDFYIGGPRNQPGHLYVQSRSGGFVRLTDEVVAADSVCEDVDGLFFDADKDGDQDLYVVSGGNEYRRGNSLLNDRLYLNDGRGSFVKSAQLPALPINKSCVAAGDIDRDGDMDLFVGSQANELQYGVVPQSYLLLNNGKGNFEVITDKSQADFSSAGMITDAAFGDFDQDGDADLLLVGEWMSPTIYWNEMGKFSRWTNDLNCNGWWQTVTVADFNGDGKPDFAAGNYGLNSKLQASREGPLLMYDVDFDNNGTREQLMAYRRGEKYYSFLGKDELEKQFPAIKKQYLRYDEFASKSVDEIFGDLLKKAVRYEATEMSSCVFINDGKGSFVKKRLPSLTQLSPVFAIAAGDYDGDRKMDLLTAGNFSGVLPYEGRYDAMMPVLCKGDGEGNFTAGFVGEGALLIDKQVRDVKSIRIGKDQCLVMGINNGSPVFLRRLMDRNKELNK